MKHGLCEVGRAVTSADGRPSYLASRIRIYQKRKLSLILNGVNFIAEKTHVELAFRGPRINRPQNAPELDKPTEEIAVAKKIFYWAWQDRA